MKSTTILRTLLILATMFMSLKAIPTRCMADKTGGGEPSEEKNSFLLKNKLPSSRTFIPHSLKGRVLEKRIKSSKQKSANVECNASELCASFDTNTSLKDVSAWIGFEYTSKLGKYFIATYSQEAKDLGNGLYATEKWDKKHFWMHIGKSIVPFPIQPRFVGIDKESGNEWYTVDYLGYRMKNANIDYSNYWENMSQSALILLINPKTKKVLEYYMEYYDENDEYVGDYDIEIGDEIESYFVGFRKGQTDREYFFSLEDITAVTAPITFSYEEKYPGKDFNTSYGKDLNLAEAEFKYIFESYGEIRSKFTEPQSIVVKTESSNNSNSSTSKSVPFLGVWILFFLIMIIAIWEIKKDLK